MAPAYAYDLTMEPRVTIIMKESGIASTTPLSTLDHWGNPDQQRKEDDHLDVSHRSTSVMGGSIGLPVQLQTKSEAFCRTPRQAATLSHKLFDAPDSWVYDLSTTAKSVVGFSEPESLRHNRSAIRVAPFFSSPVYGGLHGASSEGGFLEHRIANSVWSATSFSDDVADSSTNQKETAMSTSIQAFDFAETQSVRTVIHKNEPWFIAVDVCKVLELSTTHAMRSLDDDEYALTTIQGISRGNSQANIINESGLYALIFKSRKPAAKKFRKWVTNEVLPTLRKTGTYTIPQEALETITRVQRQELANIGWSIGNAFHYTNSGTWAFYKRLRDLFALEQISDLPSHRFDEAMKAAKEMEQQATQFRNMVLDAEKHFFKEHLRTGNQLTDETILQLEGEKA